MKKIYKSKTFQEDEDTYKSFLWVNEVLCEYSRQTSPRDPADIEVLLAHKVKVTIEINVDQ